MSLQSKNEFQIFSLHPVVQETIITDLLKTGRKHMHQVSPNEFCMLQSDLAPGLAGLFSLAENVTSFSVTERIRSVSYTHLTAGRSFCRQFGVAL